jgi:hypothetical protein
MGNRSLTDCCTLEGEGVDRITLVLSSEEEAASNGAAVGSGASQKSKAISRSENRNAFMPLEYQQILIPSH